ncbi:hypothetical protein [Mycolicibacterium aubagnense]|jgi:hypothetical protein|uniref:TetR family transcriptional regulator n=1 Tax=Mycolicibacterium aubagnense TaxID=319707 RepID=A0ABM7IN35_9MYCO|nr:hypothetical protein [Mycolicibacterium aubagnense]TLH49060.1 hypothetical protein C1S80_29005 [Mycolicibacterium aubagnense]BBX88223.1 hypothetical protein MAUB_64240 [Mycolicibacterium aubagnense]
MPGRYDLSEPDAVERDLAALFPWAPDSKLHAAAELVHGGLELSGDKPTLTDDMLLNAMVTGVAVAHLVGPAPVPGGSSSGGLVGGPISHLLRKVLPGLRHGGEHEPPTFYA